MNKPKLLENGCMEFKYNNDNEIAGILNSGYSYLIIFLLRDNEVIEVISFI